MKIKFLPTYSYSLRVVGESNYQDNIRTAIGFIDDDQDKVKEEGLEADLILEDENLYDRGNAVRVDIDGQTVGYLSKSDALAYRQSLARLGHPKAEGNCPAVVHGRWNEEVETLLFGVYLDLEPSNLKVMIKERVAKAAATTAKPSAQKARTPSAVNGKSKIPFIPIKGKGCLYVLFALPVILVLNLYILLFAGLWLGGKWIWKTATATPTSRRVSAVFASVFTVCGVMFSAVSSFTGSDPVATTPTLDLVSIQGTALAEAWLVYTQTAQASITDTPLSTATIAPTATLASTVAPLPTATLITFSTSTPFFQSLPANQPTVAPSGGSCSCSGDTMNCSDFGSWSSAQSCYTYCVSQGAGDIHRLDGNNDGSACDSLK